MRINPIAQASLVIYGITLYCIALSGGFSDGGFRPADAVFLFAQNLSRVEHRLVMPLLMPRLSREIPQNELLVSAHAGLGDKHE